MTNQLIVLAFEGTGTAEVVLDNLAKLQEEGVVEVEDVVVAFRPDRKGGFTASGTIKDEVNVSVNAMAAMGDELQIHRPKGYRQRYGSKGAGIGFVAGLLLGGPIGGAVVGGAAGSIFGRMHDHGIDKKFVNETAAAIEPGYSALFLYGSTTDRDRLIAELSPFKPRILSTTISPEQEREVRKRLSE